MSKFAFVILACLVIGLPVGCFHELNEMGRADEKREADWQAFSIEHHCKVVREPSFANASSTWECDGEFSIVRVMR